MKKPAGFKWREHIFLVLLSKFLPTLWKQVYEALKENQHNQMRQQQVHQALSTYLAAELPVPGSGTPLEGERIPALQPAGTSAALWHNLSIWRRRQILEILTLVPPRSPLLTVQGQVGKELQEHLDQLRKNRFWYPGREDRDSNILVDPQELERLSRSSALPSKIPG